MTKTKTQKKITFYVMRNSGQAVFVKEGKFFESQGGLTAPWGRAWKKIKATSIEDARTWGEKNLPPCVF
jgi:hypothetical protein